MSGDKIMTAVFERGEDIHTRTAAEIFDVLPDKVTAAMRRKAKVLNFGILYGMGVLGFQRAAKVSREEAKGFIERYMAEFSGIAEYVEKIKSEARENGYVKTIFGRRRNILEINSKMPQLLSQAERIAVNSPIQGSAADLIKLAMIQIQELLEVTYKDSVHMLLQIHDELLFEMDPEVVNEASGNIKKIIYEKQIEALSLLRKKLEKKDYTEQELFNEFYEICKNTDIENTEFFKGAYLALIGKEKGPRLTTFILAIGKEKVIKLLKGIK